MKVFFSGGLPKSGSNMIKNVLSQNKKIAIHPYSPIVDSLNIIKSTLFNQETLRNKKKDSFEECIKQFFNQGMVGWANGLNKKASVYIDDNRNWLGNLQDLENIFNGKMIVFIKDLKSIINSLEYIYINKIDYNTSFTSDFYQYQPNNKQLQRVIKFFNGEGMKITLNGIHRIIEEKNKNNFYFIKYENFVSNPNKELKNIYKFLNIPYFKHDLNNIKISFDTPLSHIPWGNVRHFNNIKKLNTKNILNKESIMYIETNFKWFYDFFYKI
jgi:sulfotransferase